MFQRELRVHLAFQMLEDRHLLSAVAFVEHGRIALGHIVNWIESADFDNDGHTDILATGYADLIGPGGMSVHRGWSGDSALATQILDGVEDGDNDQGEVWSLVADVDGDGFEDVVALSYDSLRVRWFQNDGHGSFLDPAAISDQRGSLAAGTADFDADGDEEVIWAREVGSFPGPWDCDLVLSTNDNLLFQTTVLDNECPARLMAVDVDRDQDADIVTFENSGAISWFENTNGRGSFSNKQHVGELGFRDNNITPYTNLLAADIDGDGDSDLVIGNGSEAYWFENTNGGQFERRSALVGAGGSRGIRPADMDHDGDLDLVAEKADGIYWFENRDRRGDFSDEPIELPIQLAIGDGSSIGDFVIEDVDGDGDMDVVVGVFARELGIGGEIVWFENRLIGDVTNDGVFDSSDLVKVFQVGQYEDGVAGNSGFNEGDWNGDGDFDSGDLVLAFQAGHYEAALALRASPMAAAVDLAFARDDVDTMKSRVYVP